MKIAFLTPELANEVRRMVRRERLRGHTQIQNHRKKRIPRGDAGLRFKYAKTNEEISARSGNTLGSGEASLYNIDEGDLVDSGDDATVYNFGGNVIDADVWIQLDIGADGEYHVRAVDCEVA